MPYFPAAQTKQSAAVPPVHVEQAPSQAWHAPAASTYFVVSKHRHCHASSVLITNLFATVVPSQALQCF